MPEWWTYSPADFLLFSPRTYYRLIERHNIALWPVQVLALALGGLVAALLARATPARERAAAAVVAALWVWVGLSFVLGRYATINWTAAYAAWLLVAQGLLLVGLAVVYRRLRLRRSRHAWGVLGAALFAAGAFLYPLLAPALGRGWARAEVFGVVPDPTALATLGLVLAAEGPPRARRALLLVPLAWCLLSGATLWTMGSPEAWVLLPAAAVTVAAEAVRGPRGP